MSLKTISSICGGMAVLYFASVMCCGPPTKTHVWSKNSQSYVHRKGPLALTDTEGGIGLGGGLAILMIIIGIWVYVKKQKRRRDPIIPLYGAKAFELSKQFG